MANQSDGSLITVSITSPCSFPLHNENLALREELAHKCPLLSMFFHEHLQLPMRWATMLSPAVSRFVVYRIPHLD